MRWERSARKLQMMLLRASVTMTTLCESSSTQMRGAAKPMD